MRGVWRYAPDAVVAMVRTCLIDLEQLDLAEFALDEANAAVAFAGPTRGRVSSRCPAPKHVFLSRTSKGSSTDFTVSIRPRENCGDSDSLGLAVVKAVALMRGGRVFA